jgi:L-iditol 2-dehydrogenase
MNVAELVGLKTFRISEQELAEPGPGEVQVRVAAIGVCGSDMHSFVEGGVGDVKCAYPMVLGHEPAGEVLKTGAGVTGVRAGDHVALEPAIVCYHCEFCRSGRYNLCANMRFMSSPREPGFFRDRVNIPANNLIPLPRHVGLREGTLVEPLAVVLHSMHFASVRPGETAVVFGAGPIGLLTIAALKLAGAGRVWAVEPVAHRREMAKAIDADAVLDTSDPVSEILHGTSHRGVDIAFDCAAKASTVNQCLAVLASAGRLIYTAIPVEIEVPLNMPAMRKKEITFFNVRRSNHEFNQARDLLAEHLNRFAPVLTHQRPLDQIQQAFELVDVYGDGVGKMVIEPA